MLNLLIFVKKSTTIQIFFTNDGEKYRQQQTNIQMKVENKS